MAVPAKKIEQTWEPRVIRISKKRQITIPADIFAQAGFSDYALASWNGDGLVIQPVDVDAEDETVWMLRKLLEKGLDGEALIDEYEKWRKNSAELNRLIDEGLQDVQAGRAEPFDDMQNRMKAKYGL